jgi:predicted RecB family nuclease
MTIAADIVEAFLKCPTKCYLHSLGEVGTGNAYAEWVRTQNESCRREGIKRLMAETAPGECVGSPSVAANLKTAEWRLATEYVARSQNMEAGLHAVEHIPSEGRGKPAQLIPIRFVFTNKLNRDDKLLLAFDALLLAEMLGYEVGCGKLIHGDNQGTLRVQTFALTNQVRKLTGKIAMLLSSSSPPDLVLNRHCAECEFQTRCRQKALDQDDLSLLSGMSAKERQKLRSKGIFTVTQLSYTFRPRRRPKCLRNKREKYHYSLKALAIRQKKIHIVGSPDLKIEGTPVYLDVEGLPDRDFYYLIGVRIGNGESTVQHSLWADTIEDEGKIWREFLTILETVDKPVLIHYGSYEIKFLNQIKERHSSPQEGSVADKAIKSALNLVSVIFAKIYFPTFSNGLKEIARYLGFEWSAATVSGVQSIAWREAWSSHKEPSEQQKLTCYNTEDCEALALVTRGVLGLHQAGSDSCGAGGHDIVDTTALKREHPYGFKRNTFFFPELDAINKAAYWGYQREKVYVKSSQRLRRALNKAKPTSRTLTPNKRIQCPLPKGCPHCGSSDIWKHGRARKVVYDLKFTRSGLKRWIVQYDFHRYLCRSCERAFVPRERIWSGSKFGPAILAYSIYLNIELRLPQETIDQSLNKLFGFQLAMGTTGDFKTWASGFYTATYDTLLRCLQGGALLHADETKVSVRGVDAFVWVLSSLDEVAYVYTENRESGWLRTFLKDFNGVLVSDFYAGYDGIECPKQRCLVHLLRDMNDELHKHPYDEEVKRLGKSFADLVKPMIDTADRHDLKAHFLKRHLVSVDRFYRNLSKINFGSATAEKCKRRLERNREELFTFLRHDGVPWNNNNAEHAIKPFAMLRHVINGVTSEKGLREYLVLLSVCQTCKYMGVDFLDFLRAGEKDIHAFAASRRGRTRPRQASPLMDYPANPIPFSEAATVTS